MQIENIIRTLPHNASLTMDTLAASSADIRNIPSLRERLSAFQERQMVDLNSAGEAARRAWRNGLATVTELSAAAGLAVPISNLIDATVHDPLFNPLIKVLGGAGTAILVGKTGYAAVDAAIDNVQFTQLAAKDERLMDHTAQKLVDIGEMVISSAEIESNNAREGLWEIDPEEKGKIIGPVDNLISADLGPHKFRWDPYHGKLPSADSSPSKLFDRKGNFNYSRVSNTEQTTVIYEIQETEIPLLVRKTLGKQAKHSQMGLMVQRRGNFLTMQEVVLADGHPVSEEKVGKHFGVATFSTDDVRGTGQGYFSYLNLEADKAHWRGQEETTEQCGRLMEMFKTGKKTVLSASFIDGQSRVAFIYEPHPDEKIATAPPIPATSAPTA